MSPTTKVVAVQVKALGARQVETIASTGTLDREGDRILPSAWQLDDYRRTGMPVLWAHDMKAPPVARSLDVRVVGHALRTVDEFPPPGIYPLADQVHDLVRAGFITSKSVGFRPLAWTPNDEGGRNYTRVELLEHSYVSVPANAEAVVTAKQRGVRDRAALDRFFAAPRGSDVVLLLDDDEPETFLVDPVALVLATHGVLDPLVRREVDAGLRRAGLGHALDEDVVVVLNDDAESVVVVDPADVTAALDAALAPVIQRAVRHGITNLTGRVE
jgi:HK97 family phage prohead protease